jgi:hypothetical protein
MGSCEVIASGILFTDGNRLASGEYGEKADGSSFAASPLEVVLLSDMPVPLVVNVVGINELGEEQTIESNQISGSQYSTMTLLPSGKYVDVTNVEYVSGGNITNKFTIKTVVERDIHA